MVRDEQHRRLADSLAASALVVHEQATPQQVLDQLVQTASDAVATADGAGIAKVQRRRITTVSPTDDAIARLHHQQMDCDEGPCLESLREHHIVVVDDLATDTRWPGLARHAADIGVHSVLAADLSYTGRNYGSFNLYAKARGAFGLDDQLTAGLFARHAAIALDRVNEIQHLNIAVSTRDAIGQAKGILIQRDSVTGAQAFDMLVRASQETNVKLGDVARWLIDDTTRHARETE